MVDDPLPGLHWGIKASFVDYVARMPDGRGSISHGARPTKGNTMVFEPAAPSQPLPAGADLLLAFRGDVRFAGHGGLLFVRIADPWVTVRDGAADLSVLDPFRPDEAPRIPLVRFSLEPQTDGPALSFWRGTDVRLMPEATTLFNDVYPAGELFEPIAIYLPTGQTAPQAETLS